MPLHIENLTSEITVLDSGLPLTEEQIEKLVKIVLLRVQQQARDAARRAANSCIDRKATSLDKAD